MDDVGHCTCLEGPCRDHYRSRKVTWREFLGYQRAVREKTEAGSDTVSDYTHARGGVTSGLGGAEDTAEEDVRPLSRGQLPVFLDLIPARHKLLSDFSLVQASRSIGRNSVEDFGWCGRSYVAMARPARHVIELSETERWELERRAGGEVAVSGCAAGADRSVCGRGDGRYGDRAAA